MVSYRNAIAGAIGGLANVSLMHPFDTVKTRLQVMEKAMVGSRGSHITGDSWMSPARWRRNFLFDTIRSMRIITRHEGILALYKGVFPAMMGGTISWAFYFYWFNAAKSEFGHWGWEGPLANFCAGSSAGIMTALMTNPIWVIKTRLQLQTLQHSQLNSSGRRAVPYRGFWHGARCVVQEEGFRGLYKGIGPSLWLVSHGAFQFMAYEYIKERILRYQDSPSELANLSTRDSLLASTLSKVFAATLTYPLQVVRTRMQQRGVDTSRYGTFLKGARTIWAGEGLPGFYRGLGANVIRVTPSAAITFVTYERVMRLLS